MTFDEAFEKAKQLCWIRRRHDVGFYAFPQAVGPNNFRDLNEETRNDPIRAFSLLRFRLDVEPEMGRTGSLSGGYGPAAISDEDTLATDWEVYFVPDWLDNPLRWGSDAEGNWTLIEVPD